MAWRARSRPCLADPPAESPSTMKISLSSRSDELQSLSLPGSVRRLEVAGLAHDLLLRGAARLARPRREDDARDDRLGDADVRVQPVLERRPHLRIDRRHDFRVVEAILGLPLELRLLHEHAEHDDHAFANVFGGQRDALRRQVVRLDEVPHGLAEAGAESVLVRAARSRRDAVDVAPHVLVGRLRPLERQIEAETALVALLGDRERRFVHRHRRALGQNLLQVVGEALGVLEHVLGAGRLVLERQSSRPCAGSSRPPAAAG